MIRLRTLFQSIKARLLLMLLGLTTISVLVVAILSVNSIIQTGQQAKEAASETLRLQAEEFLINLIVATAENNDLRLERIRQDADNAAGYAVRIWVQPELFSGSTYWRAEDYAFVGSEGQFINGADDTSTLFAPNSVEVDDEFIAELE